MYRACPTIFRLTIVLTLTCYAAREPQGARLCNKCRDAWRVGPEVGLSGGGVVETKVTLLAAGSVWVQGYLLIRKCIPLGTYRRPVPRVLKGS